MNHPNRVIPYHDFGGQGPILHFAHANAYPPGCYRLLMEEFSHDYHAIGIKHRALWPDAQPQEVRNWRRIADDLIDFFDSQSLQGVVGMGHSLGAVVTVFAALKRPDLFSHLVLIEPAFLTSQQLFWLHLTPPALRKRIWPMASGALKRRDTWDSPQAVFDSYRRKRIFSRLSDEALWDFIRHGTRRKDHAQADSKEVTLTFPKNWEAHIYTLAPRVWESLKQITHPTLAIRATETNVIAPETWQTWQSLQPEAKFVQIPETGHLVPMERPNVLAQIILEFLKI